MHTIEGKKCAHRLKVGGYAFLDWLDEPEDEGLF